MFHPDDLHVANMQYWPDTQEQRVDEISSAKVIRLGHYEDEDAMQRLISAPAGGDQKGDRQRLQKSRPP